MTNCPMCEKKKADNEMMPLVGVVELDAADKMADAPLSQERDVGGVPIKIVCRSCWTLILDNKEKGEIIEMLETLCGLLFEMDRRLSRQPHEADLRELIEKTSANSPSVKPMGQPDDAIGRFRPSDPELAKKFRRWFVSR